jgi:glycosyltransferase involved in cell wall biosynthesis
MSAAAAARIRGDDPPIASPRSKAGATPRPRLAYFAHNVNHADIPRRIAMLTHGGAEVQVLGFHRGPAANIPCVNLGRTEDAKLLQRVLSVLRALVTLPRWVGALKGAEVVVARNLEMLVVAAAARGLGARDARLIYECLDIHRLMSGGGAASRALRGLERFLLRRVDGLMVSSPGFVREHFAKLGGPTPPTILVENKVGVNEDVPPREAAALPAGPPWRIGWFGVIRCKRSLEMLIEAARRAPGLFEVVIAGRPATDVVGDLATELPEGSGVKYVGSFADEAELAQLYRSCHFAWLMDFYEAGANSDWLLPNRLYRAVYYGAAPIALAGVETGRWLAAHGAGLRMDSVSADAIVSTLSQFSAADYRAAKARLEAIPTEALVNGREDCFDLVARLAGTKAAASEARAEVHELEPLQPRAAAGA